MRPEKEIRLWTNRTLNVRARLGRSWPGANVYKSLKLGWHWRRLRWAVVAASEAAQGHEANGLPPGSREFKTLFNEVAGKVQEYSNAVRRASRHTQGPAARASALWSGWPIPLPLCLGIRLG